MSKLSSSPANTHASNVGAQVNVKNQDYDFSATSVGIDHTLTELRFTASTFIFSPQPIGRYAIFFIIPRGTPAGTYPLSADSVIKAGFDMPTAQLLNGYKAISGSVTFTKAPTETIVEGTFDFIGESLDSSITGQAIISSGSLSINTESLDTTISQGQLEVDAYIIEPPQSHSKDATPSEINFTFKSDSILMRPALGAPYLEIKAIDPVNKSEIYLFIPNDKLETETRLPIDYIEDGNHAIAVFVYKTVNWYLASRGEMTFNYNPAIENITASYDFFEGKNKFTLGSLDITGINPS